MTTETGVELVFALPANDTAYAGYTSAARFDLTGEQCLAYLAANAALLADLERQ